MCENILEKHARPAPWVQPGFEILLIEELDDLELLELEAENDGKMARQCCHGEHALCSGYVFPPELSDASEMTSCGCPCHQILQT